MDVLRWTERKGEKEHLQSLKRKGRREGKESDPEFQTRRRGVSMDGND